MHSPTATQVQVQKAASAQHWARSPGPYTVNSLIDTLYSNKHAGPEQTTYMCQTAHKTNARRHAYSSTNIHAKRLFTPYQLANVVAVKATAAAALTITAHEDFILLIDGQVHHSRRAQHLKR